jgi:hypothetical protein
MSRKLNRTSGILGKAYWRLFLFQYRKVMRPKSILISVVLVLFAAFWTYVAIKAIPNNPAPINGAIARQTNIWITYAAIALASWALAVSSTLHLSRKDREEWRKAGFDDLVINMMAESRGAISRSRILEVLRSPSHRGHVSNVTGIDWREVDRQMRVMEDISLVELRGKQGHRDLFGLTGKGSIALNLLESKLTAKKGEKDLRRPSKPD